MAKKLEKFPTYEELLNLDKDNEYYFIVGDICGSGYLRLYYNEDLNNKIAIDYLENGYLHSIGLPIRTKIIEGKFYNLNKTNYNNIIKFIKIVQKAIIDNVNSFNFMEEK